jgi:hypothetical protein
VAGPYTVPPEDGPPVHDRDAFQVRDLIDRLGLVEVLRPRADRAAEIIAVVQRELGAGVEVAWTAANDELILTCTWGGREHETRVGPLEDYVARAEAWCQEILRSA